MLNRTVSNSPSSYSTRQLVSFSDEPIQNNYENSNENKENKQILLINEHDPLLLSENDSENLTSKIFSNQQARFDFYQQQECMSAPALSITNENNTNNLNDDNAKQDSNSNATNKPYIYTNTNSLAPLDFQLTGSFNSSNSFLASSLPNSSQLLQRPQYLQQYSEQLVPIKSLNKTRGSKAMRVMGSTNANSPQMMLVNGSIPLKSSLSSGAMSVKSSGSGFSRSNTNKKQQQKRLFFKNGNINISRCNIDKRRRRYLTDIFTTLIDLKWRYNVLVFLLGFFISWMFFACTWYAISYVHGDLNPHHAANYTSCVSGIHGFAGAILFSIETQQTIGYGVRFTTEKCPEAIFVMMIQSSVGVMIQSFMVYKLYSYFKFIYIH
jgi:hypothetical protein